MEVSEALGKYPSIGRYYGMSAQACIKELGVEKICDNFISKFAYSCTGSRIVDLNALDFLNVAQGVVAPIYNFTFDPMHSSSLSAEMRLSTLPYRCVARAKSGDRPCKRQGGALQKRRVGHRARVTASLINVGPSEGRHHWEAIWSKES